MSTGDRNAFITTEDTEGHGEYKAVGTDDTDGVKR